jgi:hypothetical protein
MDFIASAHNLQQPHGHTNGEAGVGSTSPAQWREKLAGAAL